MGISLIIISFLATALALKLSGKERECFGSAFLKASIIHGVVISIVTELLSLNKSLAFSLIVFWWGFLVLINCGILFFLIYRDRKVLGIQQSSEKIWMKLKSQDTASIVSIFGVILVLGICLVTSLLVPPHNYDAMTYHMPRVMHWIQNRSVAHYPTHNLRQISFPPGTGYTITHLQILSGGDRFANCVQWLAFLGSVLGTSLIARNIAGVQSQIITALVCASIPMAIMQSTTPQTDLTVSFWLVCFAYFIFRADRYSKSDWFWLSASLGLAILAKPTGIIFGLPLLMILGFRILGGNIKKNQLLKGIFCSLLNSGIIITMSQSLSLPSYWRNYQTFGTFLGIDTGTRNTTIGLTQLISNILRNLALSMPLPGFWHFVEYFHREILKINVSHPAISFEDNTFEYNALWWRILLPEDENFVGNPVHLILMCGAIFSLLILLVSRKYRYSSKVLLLTVSNIIGFLLFCLLLKWQMWGNRLLLPLYILSAPVIGYFIYRFLSQSMQRILLLLLTCMAVIYALTPLNSFLASLPVPLSLSKINQIQSTLLHKREEFYFLGAGPILKQPYIKLTNQAIKDNCYSIGLDMGNNDWEYPIWPLMNYKGLPVRIKHVKVENESKKAPSEFPDADLCAIFKIKGLSTKYIKLKSP